jgi:hypothetical protein
MVRGLLIFALAFASAADAKAREFTVHGGKSSYMRVGHYAEMGVKLPPGAGGWYVELDIPGDGSKCSAEMRDVSPMPGHLPKWIEEVPNVGTSSTLTLDPSRYLGTHTYHVTLRCGLRVVSRSLVHLLNPADQHLAQKFELAQKPTSDESGPSEIEIVPKSSL